MSLIEFIQDNRWAVLVICLPLLIIYGRVLFIAALGGGPSTKTVTRPPTMPLRKLPPKPGSQIKAPSATNLAKGPALPPAEGRQEVLPGSIGAGVSGHQKAGAAKTVKLPVATPKPTDAPLPPTAGNKDAIADEMDGLFGPRDDAAAPSGPIESETAAIRRKASRLQELGFHHSIESDVLKQAEAAKTAPTTAMPPVEKAAPAPAAPPASGATTGTPETPRSSTAELTSILERIDKFLAEDTPSKPTPTIGEAAPADRVATTAVMKPITEAAAETASVADKPASPASASEPTAKPVTEAGATADTTESPAKQKTQPMWARADVTDDDLPASDTPSRSADDKKTDGGQQKLF